MWRSVVLHGALEPCGSLAQAGGERKIGDVERAREEIRVAREVCLEQVNASAMKRHHRRVGRLETVLDGISRMRCLSAGRRLSVPRRCSMVLKSTPLGPMTRAPSVSRTAVPSTLSVRGTGERQLVKRRPSARS